MKAKARREAEQLQRLFVGLIVGLCWAIWFSALIEPLPNSLFLGLLIASVVVSQIAGAAERRADRLERQ